MSEKLYKFIVAISGAVASVASAPVAYFEPAYTPAIVASIGIAETAVVEILTLFKKD
jgi:hypothetical protein